MHSCANLGSWYLEAQNVEQGISNIEVIVIYFCCSAVPCSAVRYSIMTLIALASE
jgi:hypothetical protein